MTIHNWCSRKTQLLWLLLIWAMTKINLVKSLGHRIFICFFKNTINPLASKCVFIIIDGEDICTQGKWQASGSSQWGEILSEVALFTKWCFKITIKIDNWLRLPRYTDKCISSCILTNPVDVPWAFFFISLGFDAWRIFILLTKKLWCRGLNAERFSQIIEQKLAGKQSR